MPEDIVFSTREAAIYCRVSAETIRRWIKNKGLKAYNNTGRMAIRIRKEDLEEFVAANNILVDEDYLARCRPHRRR